MLTLENVIYLLSNGLRVYTYSKLLRCFYKDSRINPVLNSTIMFLFFITNSAAYLTLNVPLLNLFSNLLFIYSAAFIYGKKVLYNIGIGSLCYALNIFIDCGFYFFVGSSAFAVATAAKHGTKSVMNPIKIKNNFFTILF